MNEEERKALELCRDVMVVGESRLYEHVSAMFRWLLATLFAANGGAMVALLNHAREIGGSRQAMGWFAAGLICSLFMGAASAFFGLRASMKIMAARLKVEGSLIAGDLLVHDLQTFIGSQKATWRTWIPSYLGGASLMCFVAGLVTIALRGGLVEA
jgi:hypothetical protein